jgi:hypothetical protein
MWENVPQSLEEMKQRYDAQRQEKTDAKWAIE